MRKMLGILLVLTTIEWKEKLWVYFWTTKCNKIFSYSIVFSFYKLLNDDDDVVFSWCNMYGRYFNFILHSTSCVFLSSYLLTHFLFIFIYLWMKITFCSFIYRNATNSDLWNEMKYTYQVDVHKKGGTMKKHFFYANDFFHNFKWQRLKWRAMQVEENIVSKV